MIRPAWLVVCAFAIGGCGGSKAPAAPQTTISNTEPAPPPDAAAPSPSSKAMATMRRFTDEMCACRDAACATDVSDFMAAWARDMAETDAEPPLMSEDEQREASELGARMGECTQKGHVRIRRAVSR